MTDDEKPAHFRRVVVAFDASPQGQALLRLAAELARCFETPLAGIFVEDESAARFAELPIAQEISLASATLQALTRERVAAHSRAQMRLARRSLDSLAVEYRLSCSFLARPGLPALTLAAIAERRDLVLVSPRVGTAGPTRRHDPLGDLVASTASGLMALTDPRRGLGPASVVALVGPAVESQRNGLAVASTIAARRGLPLQIIMRCPSEREKELRAAIEGLVASDTPLDVRTISPDGSIAPAIAREGPAIVVLAEDIPSAERQALLALGHMLLILREPTPKD